LTATRLDCGGHGRHGKKASECVPPARQEERAGGRRPGALAARTGDEGVVEHLEPRRNLLFRQDEWRTKSFAANLDLLLVLVAVSRCSANRSSRAR
jgi:ribosome biogenesis GTPase